MMKTSAILLSRQPLRPCRLTPWVRQTLLAVDWVKKNHLCLFTSLGMQTWEFLIYLAQFRKIEQVVLIPATNEHEFQTLKEFTIDQFGLDRSLVRFRAIMSKTNSCRNPSLLYDRDHTAVFEADVLIPVSIRAKGHMEDLVQKKINEKQGEVITRFQIEYYKREHPLAYDIERNKLPPETINIGNRYITHWTRAPNGPWPSENKYAYFSAVAGSDVYPRNAFNTIQNIIKTGKIIASSAHMPRGIPAVSFSGLAPDKILPLMKWRSRYRRMSFEPYGIGIEKTTARQLGIVPVRYYRKGEYPENMPFWQLQSRGVKTDWKQEAEYRYPGDFNLSDTDCSKIVCFCHTRDEADVTEKSFGIKTYAFAR
jgi:hypothetical protein